jgi:deoxyribodipyrimidine photolyase-related protein
MEITLVFPHQLFAQHPAIRSGRDIWLIEDPLYFGSDPHWPLQMHVQKLVLHRASMKAYAAEVEAAGHGVHYIEAAAAQGSGTLEILESSLPPEVREIHFADPADGILLKRIKRFAEKRGAAIKVYPSPNFLSPPDFLQARLAGRKKPFMAAFYEAQRKRMGILVHDDLSPVGGQWSFDAENRSKLPKSHAVPRAPCAQENAFTAEAIEYVSRHFPSRPGSTKNFRWPVTRADADTWLEIFINERLVHFGLYEDAISTRHASIYHAVITPALNIGLLDPQDVVNRVLAKAATSDNIPMNSLEGFIRQVIGWREFMHGLYQHHGTTIRRGNFWDFTRPLPASFYDGSTGIPPIDRIIRQLLEDGYCHHIERLMVLGNFMLLCRINPDDVYRWFMEMFVDSYDWVMVPNVYGMSQFADGGSFTTKPYISGSNYILKMSDEEKGDWGPIWDGLFWSFIADHTPFFLKNPRLSMMARSWEKMAPEKQSVHREAAARFLATLD